MCALRFVDSFDHYNSVLDKWTGAFTFLDGITNTSPRTGAQHLRFSRAIGATSPRYVIRTIDAQGTWFTGFGFQIDNMPGADRLAIWHSRDAGTTQAAVSLNTDGTFSLYRGNVDGGALLATSVLSILTGSYYFLEVQHVVDNAVGTLELRVNGVVWVTFAGDTQATANATANEISLGKLDNNLNPSGAFVLNIDYDDVYILDGTGAINNTYLGDTHVEALVPNGAGFYTNWATLVGAATNWQAVSEVPPNEDTSYVAENVALTDDSYAFANLSVANAVIPGIQVLIRAREDSGGAGSIQRLYRNAATDNLGAVIALNATYTYHIEVMETDPIALAAWTVANVNSAEFGAEVV